LLTCVSLVDLLHTLSLLSYTVYTLTCTLSHSPSILFIFFFNDTAPTEIYTLSLHDALPILTVAQCLSPERGRTCDPLDPGFGGDEPHGPGEEWFWADRQTDTTSAVDLLGPQRVCVHGFAAQTCAQICQQGTESRVVGR